MDDGKHEDVDGRSLRRSHLKVYSRKKKSSLLSARRNIPNQGQHFPNQGEWHGVGDMGLELGQFSSDSSSENFDSDKEANQVVEENKEVGEAAVVEAGFEGLRFLLGPLDGQANEHTTREGVFLDSAEDLQHSDEPNEEQRREILGSLPTACFGSFINGGEGTERREESGQNINQSITEDLGSELRIGQRVVPWQDVKDVLDSLGI